MENKKTFCSFREVLDAVRQIVFAPENNVIYVLFLGAALFINVTMFSGLFTTAEQSWFGADGICALIFYGVTACVFIAIIILSPIVYKKTLMRESAPVISAEDAGPDVTADEAPEGGRVSASLRGVYHPPVWIKMTSLLIPFAFFFVVQTAYLVGMSFISEQLELSVGQILLMGGVFIGLTAIGILLCAFFYYVTETVRWYFAGLFAFNFAWVSIAYGIASVYNSNLLLPESGVNTVIAVFAVVLILCAIFSVSVLIKRLTNKKGGAVKLSAIASVYKMTVIISVALSCGFMPINFILNSGKLSLKGVLLFLAVSLSAAFLLTYLTFRRNKLMKRICISLLIVIIFVFSVFWGIPAMAENQAYQLPDADEVESVRVSFASMENYEPDGRFDECLELHKGLLEKFREGYMPDNSVYPYKEPECVAEVWDSTWKTVSFTYVLKNGDYVHREYKGLLDEEFDEFYISYFKSDFYEYTLKNTEYNNPKIEYLSGTKDGKGSSISEEQANALLEAYCNDLDAADESDFYIAHTEIRLSNFYGYYDRVLYVPVTFKDTQRLIVEYIDKNSEN